MLNYPQGQQQWQPKIKSIKTAFFCQAILLLVWLYFNLTSLQWLWEELRQTSGFNLLLLAGVGGWLGWQAYRRRQTLLLSPQFNGLALGLLVGSAIAAVTLPWWIDLEQLPIFLFVLGSYGWLGLNLNPILWRRGFVLALLVSLLLPFSIQQGTGFGFPVRVLTAHAVEMLLKPFQVGALSSQDVIVIENQIALVDLPCSGLKSIWTGSLFLLAATWLQRRQLGWRWLGVAALNLGMLICANIGRVLALVIITAIFKQPQLAEMLHLPLGILGFLLATGTSWWLLGWVPTSAKLADLPAQQPQGRSLKFATLLPIFLALMLLGLRFSPQPNPLAPANLAALAWPSSLELQTQPLTATETDFFVRHAETLVEKQSFSYGSLTGSMLLVSSRSWRSQHAPELCFVGNGFAVDRLDEVGFKTFFARWLELNQGQNTATYWFQAQHQTTPDFSTRLWSQIRQREKVWVMVSLLFDQAHTSQEPIVQDFVGMVHQTLQPSFANPA